MVQNVFVGPWTVLPAYLPIVLGAAVLQPPLREAAQLGADDGPATPPRDALSSSAVAPASEPAPDVERRPAVETSLRD